MRTQIHRSVQLGELVAEVFDDAGRFSRDPGEVSRLAVQAIARMLVHLTPSSRPSVPA